MTNQERQKSLENRYEAKKETRGKAHWCEYCPHRINNPKMGGCRANKTKASEQMLCASAYNKSMRRNNQ